MVGVWYEGRDHSGEKERRQGGVRAGCGMLGLTQDSSEYGGSLGWVHRPGGGGVLRARLGEFF